MQHAPLGPPSPIPSRHASMSHTFEIPTSSKEYPSSTGSTVRALTTSTRPLLRTLFALTVLGLVSFDPLSAQIATGRYTGNNTNDRAVTGVGFQPDFVLVKGNAAQYAVGRTSTMSSGNSKDMGSSAAATTNMIKTFTSDGFTLGTSATVNSTSAPYFYLAIKSIAGRMKVGSYTGNGSSSQDITGIGFQPDVVWILPNSTGEAAVRMSSMSASFFFKGGSSSDIITSFLSNGFRVGSHASSNTNGNTYHYIAFKSGTDFLSVGSYTGGGGDNRSIDISMRPDYLMIISGAGDRGVHRSNQIGGDSTLQFENIVTSQNQIQAFESSGFQVGSDDRVNKSSTTFYYFAFTMFGIFESRASGNWPSATQWTLVGGTDADTIPDGNDTLHILSSHTITLTSNVLQHGCALSGTLVAAGYTVGGSGSFVMNAGATFKTGHAGGVAGTLTLTGTKTLSTTGNFAFNGSAAQVTSTTMPSTVNDLTFDNSAGVTLSQSTTVNGTLALTTGALTIGSNTLTINAATSRSSGSLTGSGTTSNISIGGSGASTTLPAVTCNNLTINRSAGISISGAVNVHGTLTMTSGNITTGSDTLTLGSSTSSLGTLSRASGTIVGRLRRWVGTSATPTLLFPIGTSTRFHPATVTYTGATTLGGTLTAFFTASDPGETGLPLTDGAFSISRAFADGFWTIGAASGLAGGTYSLDLQATSFTLVADYATLRIIKRVDGTSSWTVNGSHATGTGSNAVPIAHRTGMTGFSDFGIGGGSDNPLPIELASFELTRSEDNVQLDWRTASEVDNAGFEIQRMTPWDSEWMTIASYLDNPMLAGLGTDPFGRSYRYIDVLSDAVSRGGRYGYRLVDIAVDGARTVHPARTIELGEPTSNLPGASAQILIDRSSGVASLRLRVVDASTIRITVVNELGERVTAVDEIPLAAGTHTLSLPTASLTSGRYFVRIDAAGQTMIRALDVVR